MKFNKILIANRGEIASRIIRTCNRLNIKTVAVYSEADKDALFVREADEAVYIGASRVQDSYLKKDKLLEIAIAYNVDAIHPGYGLLSEHAPFAKLCEENEVAFIGPSSELIAQMGNKVAARLFMSSIGIPIVPGAETELIDLEDAKYSAKNVGYPIMLKASGGGGGVGLQALNSELELEQAFHNLQKRAEQLFKDSDLYIEKLITGARHIEVQAIRDSHGNCLHLFERDCSIQRRNQKVIEEGPAEKISIKTKELLYTYALKAMNKLGYENAATIEFLVDSNENVYFLEMNTRIQVEHPVTEEMIGIDIVELQIMVAEKHALIQKQSDLKILKHAIEARIYAEDSVTFFPSPGKITKLEKTDFDSIRYELAVETDSLVTPFYDPLIGKVIASGSNRFEAIEALTKALKSLNIEGIKTNIPMLINCLNNDTFQAGKITTNFVAEEYKTFS